MSAPRADVTEPRSRRFESPFPVEGNQGNGVRVEPHVRYNGPFTVFTCSCACSYIGRTALAYRYIFSSICLFCRVDPARVFVRCRAAFAVRRSLRSVGTDPPPSRYVFLAHMHTILPENAQLFGVHRQVLTGSFSPTSVRLHRGTLLRVVKAGKLSPRQHPQASVRVDRRPCSRSALR